VKQNIRFNLVGKLGHEVAYWLRHYSTNQKVAGSRPDEMIFFQFI
jgi:hypothetical protein